MSRLTTTSRSSVKMQERKINCNKDTFSSQIFDPTEPGTVTFGDLGTGLVASILTCLVIEKQMTRIIYSKAHYLFVNKASNKAICEQY